MNAQPQNTWKKVLSGYGDMIAPEDAFLALGAIQDAEGRIPRGALEEVARRSGIPVARLYGAASAYPDLTI